MAGVTHGTWFNERTPTFQGIGGWRAWKITDWVPKTIDQTATIGGYLVFCPGAHAFWSYWMLSVVHLRAIEGGELALKKHDDMTHEFMSLALSPDHPPPDPKGWDQPLHSLEPIDVLQQFSVPSDEAAERILDAAVEAIMAGQISPDSDYQSSWGRILSELAAHARGEHG